MSDLKPVAWVIPGVDNAKMNGSLDAMVWKEGEFSLPLYAIPEGYVIVPKVPTEAMLEAGDAAFQEGYVREIVGEIWEAMIAAAGESDE